MKRMITVAALAAAMAAFGATGTFAESVDKVEVDGVKFEIPEDLRDRVIVETEGLEENELVKVTEKASREAAKANGGNVEGAGWLFSIGTVSEDEMIDARCTGNVDGKDFFAEKDDTYYVYYHPTDVTFMRETTEQMEKDEADWTKVNEWAFGEVRNEIVKNNPELEAKHYSYTDLDRYLCNIANDRDLEYEIHSLKYRELDASKFDGNADYAEELTEGVTYQYMDEEPKAADGESIVFAVPKDDVRFEFVSSPEYANIIRQIITSDGEEIISYYEATFEDSEKTSTGIMEKWVEAIANGGAETEED